MIQARELEAPNLAQDEDEQPKQHHGLNRSLSQVFHTRRRYAERAEQPGKSYSNERGWQSVGYTGSSIIQPLGLGLYKQYLGQAVQQRSSWQH